MIQLALTQCIHYVVVISNLITINFSQSSTVTVTECDSFDWDGVTYDSTGTYLTFTQVNGCDSTVTLDLTIKLNHQQLQLQNVILLFGME